MDARWTSKAVTGVLVTVAGLGIALIYIGSRQEGAFPRELLIGSGAAVGPAAMVALLFRYFLLTDLEREIAAPLTAEVQRSLDETIHAQVTSILDDYRREIDDFEAVRDGGLVRTYPDRTAAIDDFVKRLGAMHKVSDLVVIGSSLKGLLPDEFCSFANIIRNDPYAVKFALTHPVVADLRAQQEGRQLTAIGDEIVERLRLLDRLGVPPSNVFLYRGAPTCFSIMSGDLRLMLLNPYPYEAVAWDAPCLLVRLEPGRNSYLYESFRRHHFGRITARTVMTEQLHDLRQNADDLERMLHRYKEVVELVERLAPLPEHLVVSPINVGVYLDTDDEEIIDGVLDRTDHLLDLLGYHPAEADKVVRGSFFRRAQATARDGVVHDEVRNGLADAKRAIELHALGVTVAAVNQTTADAAVKLLEGLTEVPSACICLYSLVMVKYTRDGEVTVISRLLTERELQALRRFPELQAHPERFFEALQMALERLGAGEVALGDVVPGDRPEPPLLA